MQKKAKSRYLVGIDEVGRGPLAGPVAVCALCLKNKLCQKNFVNFRDSKKLSPLQREKWLKKINQEKKKGNITYCVSFRNNKIIDEYGINQAISSALCNSLGALKLNPKECQVLLDGGLVAPIEYQNQKTIIKGDEKKLAIALASIVAKVTRDNFMIKITEKYSQYGFEKHKGYGTKEHYWAIKKYGLSKIHRQSFIKQDLIKKQK